MEGAQFFAFGTQSGTYNNPELPAHLLQPPDRARERRRRADRRRRAACWGGAARTGSACCRCAPATCRRSNAVATDFSVVRVQREILRRSRIGVIGTRRAPSVERVGAELRLRRRRGAPVLPRTSRSPITSRRPRRRDAPATTSATDRGSNWNPDRWGIDVEHLYAGEDFNPEVGFLRRTEGFRRTHGKFEFSPRPKNMRGVRKVCLLGRRRLLRPMRHGGRVQSRDQQALFRADFTSGDVTQFDVVADLRGDRRAVPRGQGRSRPGGQLRLHAVSRAQLHVRPAAQGQRHRHRAHRQLL